MYTQNNGIWYFKYKDDDGTTRVMSTHTRDKSVAEAIERTYKLNHKPYEKPSDVIGLLNIFTNPKTNPNRLDARITGKNYGDRHSEEVARNMRDLIELLSTRGSVGYVSLKKLTRLQCKVVMAQIHKRWGNTDKARKTFSQFKSTLAWASEQGWIPVSPAVGMDEIKVIQKLEVIPMTANDIKEILTRPELFRFPTPPCNKLTQRQREGRPEEDYAMFSLLAFTGLRRAEAAALTVGQIRDGLYRGRAFKYIEVDRAFKDSSWKEVGKPKWDLCRVIPIPNTLWEILKPYIKKDPTSRLFPTYTKSRFAQMFEHLKLNAITDCIEWEDPEAFSMLSPHKLRHALNTNLLAEQIEYGGNITETMVAEFLSWEHQDQSRMQRRYTHLTASRLLPISDAIESLYSIEEHKALLRKIR